MKPELDKTPIGVVVGRFQVHDLHRAHVDLIDTVRSNHDKVIVFLGVNAVGPTRNNPLDFETRRKMFVDRWPEITVLPIVDRESDSDWSSILLSKVREIYPLGGITLYGSRDSFIQHYTGNLPTVSLEPDSEYVAVSGTAVREKLAHRSLSSNDFRAGIVYALNQLAPRVIPVIHTAIFRQNPIEFKSNDLSQEPPTPHWDYEILLVREENSDDDRWEFVSGELLPTDTSYEQAGRRLIYKELGLQTTIFDYVCSERKSDWRLKNEVDENFSTLFAVQYLSGIPTPGDSFYRAKWVNFAPLIEGSWKYDIKEELHPMFEKFLHWFEDAYVRMEGIK